MSASKKKTARKTPSGKKPVKKAAKKKATKRKVAKSATKKKATKKKVAKRTATKKKVAKKRAAKKATKKKVAAKTATRPAATKASKKKAPARSRTKTSAPRASRRKSSSEPVPQVAASRAPAGGASSLPWVPITAGHPILPPDDRYLAEVIVFGGGISGLTAAHELADRGFRVVVIEKQRGLNRFGHDRMALGGMARSQYLRVPFEAGARWWMQGSQDDNPEENWPALPAKEVGGRSSGGFYVEVPDAERLSAPAKATLRKEVDRLGPWTEPSRNQGRTCPFLVVTPLNQRDPSGLGLARQEARRRAALVRDFLVEECGVDKRYVNELIISSKASKSSEEHQLGNPPPDSPWVGIRLDQSILPGEHGFRFFPSYYRHMFDTMHRIPVQTRTGGVGERTVYDNLRSARIEAFATRGRMPVVSTRSADLSPTEQMHAMVLQMQNGEYTPLDIQQFLGRLMRYMCACPERRSKEYNHISWWQFIAAYDPQLGVDLLRYSREFEDTVKFSGKVLAAFDADRGDAHTNGDTYVQLFLSTIYKNQSNAVDGTLNAPTTEALFEPWRNHLQALGVTFMTGELTDLDFDPVTDAVVPHVVFGSQEPGRSPGAYFPMPVRADYYVMATDVVTAEYASTKLPQIGVPGGLQGYTTTVYPGPHADPGEPVRYRNPFQEPGLSGWDRLQTLAGIQYFFPSDLKLVFGHIYFTDAHWALSSITEPVFWTRRPTLAQNGYASLLSVDIGSWRTKGSEFVDHRKAWECTEMEIGQEVWRQIQVSLKAVELGKRNGTIAMPQPTWFHIDSNIQFDDKGIVGNRAPFLVPMVSDWHNRPGTDPWVPTGPPLPGGDLVDGLWQADHGGYLVHWKQLVFAGTYLKTTTRMTTMESANESARHAVNAILDHYVAMVGADEFLQATLSDLESDPDHEHGERTEVDALFGADPNLTRVDHIEDNSSFLGGAVPEAERVLGNSGAPITSGTPGEQSPIFPTTWIGDYCQIWNPETYEPPDLRPLRNLDKAFFDAGLPHMFDVLGLEPHLQTARAAHAATGAASPEASQWLRDLASQVGNSAPLDLLRKVQSGTVHDGTAQKRAGSNAGASDAGAAAPAFDPLDPLGIGRLHRDWISHVEEHLRRAGELAGASAAQSTAAGIDTLLGLDEAGLEGWQKFLDFVEAMSAGTGDASSAQAEILEVLERIRRELEAELFGGSASDA